MGRQSMQSFALLVLSVLAGPLDAAGIDGHAARLHSGVHAAGKAQIREHQTAKLQINLNDAAKAQLQENHEDKLQSNLHAADKAQPRANQEDKLQIDLHAADKAQLRANQKDKLQSDLHAADKAQHRANQKAFKGPEDTKECENGRGFIRECGSKEETFIVVGVVAAIFIVPRLTQKIGELLTGSP
eukprot:TRINITY_DN2345_c0_g1_i1.p1 TRINITY_DN2345_c0_g1~~TRINITY_DN2345_c0_g1_i1.p1  ORF type:complete len:186 (+),score=49.52 TRINITY_DN2345_c0_g1_i1:60-617(+)